MKSFILFLTQKLFSLINDFIGIVCIVLYGLWLISCCGIVFMLEHNFSNLSILFCVTGFIATILFMVIHLIEEYKNGK